MERVWRQNYVNYEKVKLNLTDYIINFYNSHYLHSALDYDSSNIYEMKHVLKQLILVSTNLTNTHL